MQTTYKKKLDWTVRKNLEWTSPSPDGLSIPEGDDHTAIVIALDR